MKIQHHKTMCHFMSAACLVLISMGPAHAYAQQTDANEWVHAGIKYTLDRPYHKETDADAVPGEIIYTTDSNKNGLLFSCIGEEFRVTSSLRPQNLQSMITHIRIGRAFKYVDMSVNDGPRIGLKRWLYDPRNTFLRAEKRSATAKLYNGVIRGGAVRLHIEGRKAVLLDLPKPNRAFAEFGAACGIGKFAKKK